jgi:hypothetical protein
MIDDPEVRESLTIIAADLDETRDLALNGNRAVIAKVGQLEATLKSMHDMLAQVIRSDANRAQDWETSRRADSAERVKDRSRLAKIELKLGLSSNGAR